MSRSSAAELMEELPPEEHSRALAELERVNRLTSMHGPLLRWIAAIPAARTLLDVGCGRGDLLRAVARRRPDLALRGIDASPVAVAAASAAAPGIAFAALRFEDAADEWASADVIVSSQMAHHLTDAGVVGLLRFMERGARLGWAVLDLHRHWIARHGFAAGSALLGIHPVVRHDGRVSVARGFVAAEWRGFAAAAGLPPGAVRVS